MLQAQEIIRAAKLQETFALEPLKGAERDSSREVWLYGPYVLRIDQQPTVLVNEARLLRSLPVSIPHAPVVASGDGWLVQQRIPGEPLSRVWRSLSEARQRAAVQQLAAILINLHQMRIGGMPSLSPGWFPAILPADILRLAARLRSSAPEMVVPVSEFTRRAMQSVPPPLRWGFIHRDLHFGHVLWNGDRITALLDFESAVMAPRELELDMILRFVRFPSLYSELEPSDLEALPGWLKEDYPLLFGEAGIERRLPLYSIEHDLRQFAANPDPAVLDRVRAVISE